MLISSFSFSQDTSNTIVKWEDTSATKKAIDDSQRFIDSMKYDATYQQTQQNMDWLVRMQDERRAKQKKQAILYLSLGVFFLIVMLVGLRRRVKK